MITQTTPFKPVTVAKERPLITIEFAPDIHQEETEYQYEHPQFVFGDRVILVNEYPELEFTVCALELIESKTSSGKLLNQPRWKYKVTDADKNSYWKEESALERSTTKKTCLTCSEFNNYQDNYGKGWCNLFNRSAKTSYKKTDDCILNGALELDTAHCEYEIGSIVKVIDEDENHTEWAVFEIVKCEYNQTLYRNQGSYLTEPEWFYQLKNLDGENVVEPMWVGETKSVLSILLTISVHLKSFN